VLSVPLAERSPSRCRGRCAGIGCCRRASHRKLWRTRTCLLKSTRRRCHTHLSHLTPHFSHSPLTLTSHTDLSPLTLTSHFHLAHISRSRSPSPNHPPSPHPRRRRSHGRVPTCTRCASSAPTSSAGRRPRPTSTCCR
jgi:hypothetical protein